MSNTFQIEKNIDIPSPVNEYHNGYRGLFPFPAMQKGDSFLMPCAKVRAQKEQRRLYASALWYKKTHDKDFKVTTRTVSNGVRIWRV